MFNKKQKHNIKRIIHNHSWNDTFTYYHVSNACGIAPTNFNEIVFFSAFLWVPQVTLEHLKTPIFTHFFYSLLLFTLWSHFYYHKCSCCCEMIFKNIHHFNKNTYKDTRFKINGSEERETFSAPTIPFDVLFSHPKPFFLSAHLRHFPSVYITANLNLIIVVVVDFFYWAWESVFFAYPLA